MSGGTEAFPDLGRHCQNPDCHQLDFLPFTCDSCHKVFCVEHRLTKSHSCSSPNHNSRQVHICNLCSSSIETTGTNKEEEIKLIIEKHENSPNCDPSKKKKSRCPVNRCKQILTFSNNSVCKKCRIKVCLLHRFPADHGCGSFGKSGNFLLAFAAKNEKDCGTREGSICNSPPSVKAC
ncbi:hypothetical protein GIB67_039046 [Kingdonia uniflora]|uniref:AN1-type domain-containing protein n=1 Tax=Kingdonia uniflora TaxID=39325 RepID=A0A7J7LKY6_9MAGN|nr:hypothetical protein GIB67_039046 [Kingdonia uniflora]